MTNSQTKNFAAVASIDHDPGTRKRLPKPRGKELNIYRLAWVLTEYPVAVRVNINTISSLCQEYLVTFEIWPGTNRLKKINRQLNRIKLETSIIVNYFNPVSSIHSYNTRQSQIDNLFVKSVHTTQYGIRSLSYTGPKLWNSLSIDVKKIKPFSSFRQYIKNSVIDGYNTIIDS